MFDVSGHTTLSRQQDQQDRQPVSSMTLNPIDSVWSSMRKGEFYSHNDLANKSGQPIDAVGRISEFLVRYGFAERLTTREPILRKLSDAPHPGDASRILQALLEDAASAIEAEPRACRSRKRS